MKHVFLVHSHTTYLTAMGVINKLRLPYKDVIFIISRKYRCVGLPVEIEQHDEREVGKTYIGSSCIPFSKHGLSWIKQFDRAFEKVIHEDFTFYSFDIVPKFFQLIASNRYCVDLKFIQDGITDKCAGEGVKRTYPLTCRIKNFIARFMGRDMSRIKKLPIHGGNYGDDYPRGVRHHASETFAISDGIFKKVDCKHTIVEWPRVDVPLTLADDGVYFVLDSSVEIKSIERDIYMTQVEKMIKKFSGKHNYIKFHPAQKDENKEYILSLFKKNGIQVEELPDDVPFEMILASQPHMKVCGFTTSLVFFSALMPQHETHICMPALCVSKRFVQRVYNDRVNSLRRCYGDKFVMETL